MNDASFPGLPSPRIVALGVGAFTQAMMRTLREDGAETFAWLTRDYGHYGPSLEGPCLGPAGDICGFLRDWRADLIVPMSLDWALKPWTADFLSLKPPLLSPIGEGLRLERERYFASALCARSGVPFAHSWVAATQSEAASIVRREGVPMVIKNPLCAPNSPIHTVVCETVQDTLAWIERLDDAEGLFLQEYLGRREAGHVALVSGGDIQSLVTNQEYKRAFDGNLGIVAGAPLGGLVEVDFSDRYGLARDLLMPLRPWFAAVDYRGPVQVTALKHKGVWKAVEYNVRLGVTSGPLIARLLSNPVATFLHCVRGEPLTPRWRSARFGCCLTFAGYGYPYTELSGPRVPLRLEGTPSCDIWWQEVSPAAGGALEAVGHRLAEVCAIGSTLEEAVAKAYENIRRLSSLGAYYRTDVGQSLWPPGEE